MHVQIEQNAGVILRKSSESVIKRDSTTAQQQQYRSQPAPPLNSSQASQVKFQHSVMVSNGVPASVLQVFYLFFNYCVFKLSTGKMEKSYQTILT